MTDPVSLSDSLHACRVGDTWVLLQTVQDRYFVLTGHQARWFSEIAAGTPRALCPQAAAFEERLCARAILPRPLPAGHRIAEPGETGSLENLPETPGAPIRLQDAALFTRTFLALCHLQDPKRRRLERLLASARRWKDDAQRQRRAETAHTASLTRTFHALTPWFFSSHDACFFRSLMLVRFLSHYGIAADWTFGVRVSPFRAHCWVTCDGYLLTGDRDSVAGYQPILTV
jgi:hypothetical protein